MSLRSKEAFLFGQSILYNKWIYAYLSCTISRGQSILKPEKRFSPRFHVHLKHWVSDPDWIPHVIPNWGQHFPVKKRLSTTTTPLHLKQTHPDPAPIHPTNSYQTPNQKTQPETFLPPWLLLSSLLLSAEAPPPLHDAPHRKRRSWRLKMVQTVGSLQLPWMKVRPVFFFRSPMYIYIYI